MKNPKQFAALYITNFWGVMNDNILKILVCFIAATWVDEEYRSLVVSATAGALVLPYLIFSPLAGKLPMYCNKLKVLRMSKLAEMPIMIVAIAGFMTQSLGLAVGAVLLMGLQSALYSPSKYGLIKDIGGVEGVSQGMGGMEAVAFLGILLGTEIASFLAEMEDAFIYCSTLMIIAILGAVCSYTLKVKEETEFVASSANVIKFIRDTNKILHKYRGMSAIIHTLSLFWWLSALIQMVLVIYCPEELGLTPSQTGYVLTATAIGITLGCLVGGNLDKRTYLLGYTPLLGIAVCILLTIIYLVDMSAVPFAILIFCIAFIGGIFKIPFDAEIQKRVDASELNVVLAYFNQISFIYIFLASATNILITQFFPTRAVFLCMAVVFFVAMFIYMFNYRPVICYTSSRFMHTHYRVKYVGRELLKQDESKNLLILPNHTAVVDPLLLFAEMHDVRMQPLVDEGYFRIPVIKHVLGLFDAIEVPDLRLSRKGVEKVQALGDVISSSLAAGCNVLFYPSGHITTDGRESIGTRQLAYNTCLSLPDHTRVVAIRMTGLWGSQWSRYGLNHTPSLVALLLKSFALIFSTAIFFRPKRDIKIEYIDITADVKAWREEGKLSFNKHLEELYNAGE